MFNIKNILESIIDVPGEMCVLGTGNLKLLRSILRYKPCTPLHVIKSYESDHRETVIKDLFIKYHSEHYSEAITHLYDLRRYSFIYIATEFYESTKDILTYFASRLSPGGTIIVENFDQHGPRCAVEDLLESNDTLEYAEGIITRPRYVDRRIAKL